MFVTVKNLLKYKLIEIKQLIKMSALIRLSLKGMAGLEPCQFGVQPLVRQVETDAASAAG